MFLQSAPGTIPVGKQFHDQHVLILAMSLVPSAICLAAIIAEKQRDYFSPLYLLLYMTFIGSFLKAFFLLYLDTDKEAKRIVLGNLDLVILLPGAIVLSIGTFAAVCGYFLKSTSSNFQSSNPENVLSISGTRWFAVLSLIVGTVMFIFFFQALDLGAEIKKGVISAKRIHKDTVGVAPRGAALGYLRMGAQTLPQIALILHAANFMVRKKFPNWPDLLLMIALCALSLLLPFLTSSRLEMFYLFIILLIIFHYCVKQVSILHCAGIAIVFLILLSVLGQIRVYSNPNYKGDETIRFGIEKALKSTIGRGYFMGIDKTSVIVDAVPDRVDYLYGRSLYLFIYGPIPRALWPDKPVIRIGLEVGKKIYNRKNNSGIPPGFIGELYFNYGKTAVAVGMFLYGVLCALLYKHTILIRKNTLTVSIYAIGTLFLSFTLLSGDLTILMSQLFRYGLCLGAGLIFVYAVFPKLLHLRTEKQSPGP